ncbi:hypothetical protein ABRY23_12700 [Melioribacteraceae bacterium 4301-Me]|uniref:hypothetical protein n=1 Tax=Pyranulibacter aquaticus TaxID=3163344 RepID=UPI0035972796
MSKQTYLWVLAILITIASAVYQRITGPTYPLTGGVLIDGHEIKYRLERSYSTSSNYLIKINTGESEIKGNLFWRKYKSNSKFNSIQMKGNKVLSAELPRQKRLEKLEYYIELYKDNKTIKIPKDNLVIIRFKDDVPALILIPHIIVMFLAMMFSTRAGLEFFNKEPKLNRFSFWTVITLFIGGFPLGFAMNGFAFGEIWGGWPFGTDVTDNKTQIAFITWLLAFFMVKKNMRSKYAVLAAAIVMLIVYMIPHSS